MADRLRAELAEVVRGLDPDTILASQAPGLWAVFDQIERLAGAGKTLVARRVEESRVWRREGLASAADYIARRSGATQQAARSALATSKRLPKLPNAQEALRRGDLSVAQVHPIADAASENPAAESRLLDAAKRCSLKELRQESLRVKAAADPDPGSTRRRQRAERYFRQGIDDEGAWVFWGRGAPECAGMFKAVLDPLVDQKFKQAWREGLREERDRYAFDAFMEMARRAHAFSHNVADTGEDVGSGSPDDRAPGSDSGGHVDSQDDPSGDTVEEDDDAVSSGDRGRGSRRKQKRPPSMESLAILRLDLKALRRGYVRDDELCETVGFGPVPVPAARDLLAQSVVKLVITYGHEVVSVTHLGEGLAAFHRLYPETTRLPADEWKLTHLALLHVDARDLACRAEDRGELCDIAGVGAVPVAATRELLGPALLDLVGHKGVAVSQVVHEGRKPTVVQRSALWWTQPICSVEGCPRTFTEIDHREDWARTKHTTLRELDRLCRHDHRLKTTGGWALVPGTGKRPFVPPHDPRHPAISGRAWAGSDGGVASAHPTLSNSPTAATPATRPRRAA